MEPSNESFDALVIRTRDALTAYLRQYLTTPEDIQDVLQEAYLKVYCVLRNKRNVEHMPSSLLYTTARNIALSRLRHRQVVARSAPAVAVSEELRRESRTAFQQLSRNERRRRLMRAVNDLPPKCREVFVLRMIESLSQREIGERLGIAVSTVEKHLAKGLRLCKQTIAAQRAANAVVEHVEPASRKAAS
ncbi:RNA polymerase sigma factor [Woeseia oceani]|nr:sigma-70 family RNA polymerase sigma factor [Woeseia oceani]